MTEGMMKEALDGMRLMDDVELSDLEALVMRSGNEKMIRLFRFSLTAVRLERARADATGRML